MPVSVAFRSLSEATEMDRNACGKGIFRSEFFNHKSLQDVNRQAGVEHWVCKIGQTHTFLFQTSISLYWGPCNEPIFRQI